MLRYWCNVIIFFYPALPHSPHLPTSPLPHFPTSPLPHFPTLPLPHTPHPTPHTPLPIDN
ncbi:MAG: hypothetical protein O9332_13690 [Microcystis sp. LE19-10.1B]|uniref:hypothetical protein n=1 Tax=Microcystis sp. LE19-10.1B TaxID=3016428 RepID=UPI0022C3CE2A|nr:hypothetical protein [Microcystis sp. LE19-10.1B]MCZ8026426.1 hypothetical protein [Microcystis sp. LE19-10.1B]